MSEFCICPPGWFRWTHRVIEALLKGAIPILEDDEKLYNIELQDMENCLLVKNSDWGEAIDRAFKIDASKRLEMQFNILKICKKYLIPQSASENMKLKLGLTKQHEASCC